ncbi:hypothetical protein DXG01_007702 [Tephrocybe rancida]|nr:hypothetical protein DXG01_007702 [Tephrocybe rancida]
MNNFFFRPARRGALLFLLLVPRILADPAVARFTDCFDEASSNSSQKLEISTVYAQVLENDGLGMYLNLTVLGSSPQPIQGFTNSSTSLATLFTTTNVLTLNAWTNSTYFCNSLRPPSPLPALDSTGTYCPIQSGEFGFSTTIPWGEHRALTTLSTRLRAVDPSIQELMCIDVITTPLDPQPNSPYGQAKVIFWSTVALAIAYWVIVGLARTISAWGRGITRHDGLWSRAQSAGFIVASAISGERFATSPALMRFCTPSMRDIVFHTQWCAVLAMVAVEWPPFVYPILTQTAWSTLTYNITIVPSSASHHWNPFFTPPYPPQSKFQEQLNDVASPLFINTSVPNILFTLPDEATDGLSSFAYTIGIRPQDLFPVCLILFLGIIATAILLAILVWFIDYVACSIANTLGGHGNTGPNAVSRLTGARSPGFSNIKDVPDTPNPGILDERKSLNGMNTAGSGIYRPSSRFGLALSTGGSTTERGINSHRAWWRFRSDLGSFHSSVLHGNLVRILLLFHLPVTIFSVYQMVMSRDVASVASKALAALSFALFSVVIPAHLVIRVTFTTTSKLYDETRTLLSYGPLYNHYRHGSQLFAALFFATNLAFGITIGAGQKSGTAQAIIILVIEIVSALVTSIWLPWGTGASMGLISFLFCVARIVVAVLLLILSPTISIGSGAGGWVAYGILIILALVFLALLLMLLVKLSEALVRIFGAVGFDRSRHVVDSGLLGACGLLGCCGSRKRHGKRRTREQEHAYRIPELRQPEPRDSDVSSYIPPAFPNPGEATPPRFLGSESRKGSSASGPPPSVLRPEQAMRPYREDSEDEGYIMGAWKPFPKPGYAPVLSESPLAATSKSALHQQLTKPSQTTLTTTAPSGFSRVGGGRAHIDTPYAITAGSTHTFPSIGQSTMPAHTIFDNDESPPPSLSNVEGRQPDFATLPPGAMQPSHIRTKSQTAIVEDAGILATFQGLGSSSGRTQRLSSGGLLRPPVMTGMPADYGDDDSEEMATKKKSWFRLGRNRAHSSEGSAPAVPSSPTPPALPMDEEMGGVGETPQPTRSFVVIRKPQPGSAGSRSANTPS